MACRRFLVRGRVQGVWFRASTRQQAERLGLTGQAVNLADGRVEVTACGPEAMLDELAAWLWQGPELARVDDVSIEEVAPRHFSGFETG
jgi:acylphosphatase